MLIGNDLANVLPIYQLFSSERMHALWTVTVTVMCLLICVYVIVVHHIMQSQLPRGHAFTNKFNLRWENAWKAGISVISCIKKTSTHHVIPSLSCWLITHVKRSITEFHFVLQREFNGMHTSIIKIDRTLCRASLSDIIMVM